MLQGDMVLLHRGTVCDVCAPGKEYHEARCQILGYNAETARWRVRLQGEGGDWTGKSKQLAEKALSLGFAVLPTSLSANIKTTYVPMTEIIQDDCGRGLCLAGRVRSGQPIYAETPLMVVSTSTDNDVQKHYNERFLAYTTLGSMMNAGSEAATRAFNAFEDLSPEGVVPPHLSAAARAIHGANDPESMSPDQREATLQIVQDVLMRFEANQFGFDNGTADNAVNASAIYPKTSRLNHSCNPSVSVMTKASFCKNNPKSGSYHAAEHADMLVVVALRDLEPGDALTSNYVGGLDERGNRTVCFPPDWDVHKRQRLLKMKGFVCKCERCVEELRAEAAAHERHAGSTSLTLSTTPDAEGGGDVPSAMVAAMPTEEESRAARRKVIEEQIRIAREKQTVSIAADIS